MRSTFRKFLLLVFFLGWTETSFAGPPFLNIEGEGGGGINPFAYLINPPAEGEIFGRPSISAWEWIGNGYNFSFQSTAINIGNRAEIGFGAYDLDISDLRDDLYAATDSAVDLRKDHVRVFHVHGKLLLLKEAEVLPAFSVGAGYKWNTEIEDLDLNTERDAGVRAFTAIGYDRDDSAEFTAVATKTIPWALPTIISAGARISRGHQMGLLGFDDTWHAGLETTIAVLPADKVALGFEYKQKPDGMKSLGPALNSILGARATSRANDFTFKEDDFIDWFFLYMPTSKLSFIAAWATIGNVVHTEVDMIWAFNVKYDF